MAAYVRMVFEAETVCGPQITIRIFAEEFAGICLTQERLLHHIPAANTTGASSANSQRGVCPIPPAQRCAGLGTGV